MLLIYAHYSCGKDILWSLLVIYSLQMYSQPILLSEHDISKWTGRPVVCV